MPDITDLICHQRDKVDKDVKVDEKLSVAPDVSWKTISTIDCRTIGATIEAKLLSKVNKDVELWRDFRLDEELEMESRAKFTAMILHFKRKKRQRGSCSAGCAVSSATGIETKARDERREGKRFVKEETRRNAGTQCGTVKRCEGERSARGREKKGEGVQCELEKGKEWRGGKGREKKSEATQYEEMICDDRRGEGGTDKKRRLKDVCVSTEPATGFVSCKLLFEKIHKLKENIATIYEEWKSNGLDKQHCLTRQSSYKSPKTMVNDVSAARQVLTSCMSDIERLNKCLNDRAVKYKACKDSTGMSCTDEKQTAAREMKVSQSFFQRNSSDTGSQTEASPKTKFLSTVISSCTLTKECLESDYDRDKLKCTSEQQFTQKCDDTKEEGKTDLVYENTEDELEKTQLVSGHEDAELEKINLIDNDTNGKLEKTDFISDVPVVTLEIQNQEDVNREKNAKISSVKKYEDDKNQEKDGEVSSSKEYQKKESDESKSIVISELRTSDYENKEAEKAKLIDGQEEAEPKQIDLINDFTVVAPVIQDQHSASSEIDVEIPSLEQIHKRSTYDEPKSTVSDQPETNNSEDEELKKIDSVDDSKEEKSKKTGLISDGPVVTPTKRVSSSGNYGTTHDEPKSMISDQPETNDYEDEKLEKIDLIDDRKDKEPTETNLINEGAVVTPTIRIENSVNSETSAETTLSKKNEKEMHEELESPVVEPSGRKSMMGVLQNLWNYGRSSMLVIEEEPKPAETFKSENAAKKK